MKKVFLYAAKMGHQVARNVLHAVTGTKVDACQRTCNLAVLVAE